MVKIFCLKISAADLFQTKKILITFLCIYVNEKIKFCNMIREAKMKRIRVLTTVKTGIYILQNAMVTGGGK